MKLKLLLTILLVIITGSGFSQNLTPFNRGVNLTIWFQTDSSHIQFGKYDQSDFANIKSLGADVIRIPVDLKAMTSPSPDYKVSSTFLFYVDNVLDWADSLGMHIVLDNHTFDPAINTEPSVINWMIPAWQQIATHYLGKYPNLYFEILNEPHGITSGLWNIVQDSAISAIRQIDANRTLIIGGVNFNNYAELNNITVHSDQKLIYTFHYYDPFLFTHQGASWLDPSFESVTGIPFPYNVNTMPSSPPAYTGTWVESLYNDYHNQGTEAKINEQIEIANTFRKTRNVPVWCGEFGVYIPNSPNNDRLTWYNIVSEKLEADSIAWTMWDYQHAFGMFNPGTNERFDYDLNLPMVSALGLTSPGQLPDVKKPDSSQIIIYSDWMHKGISDVSYIPVGSLNFHDTQTTATGRHAISLSGIDQYNGIQLKFSEIRDFTKLKTENYYVELSIKGTSGISSLDLRFIDSKISTEDHPWRSRVTLNSSKVSWDNTWQTIQIPLTSFVESGSFDGNTFYGPAGLFDWTSIEQLDLIAEDQSLAGETVFIDNIKITKNATVPVELVEFKSSLLGGKISLNWKTKTETDNYGFEIEKCFDSAQHDGHPELVEGFHKIGFVAGKGTTTTPQTYSFTDSEVKSAVTYYRLKQLDNNGNFSYSAVEKVETSPNSFLVSNAYPNPFNPTTQVKVSLPEKSKIRYQIYDAIGKLVIDGKETEHESGVFAMKIDLSKQSSGLYLLNVSVNNKKFNQKLVLTK